MRTSLLITLLSLVFLFQGTSDLYASSMPAMTAYFKTNTAGIQLTIIVFLIAYGIGQFFWVYYSEKYTRKSVILFNIGIFIFASILAGASSTLPMLYLARALQGLAISALNLNVKAMPLEIFNKDDIKIFYTYFALCWGAGGTLAPWIGSNIQYAFSWHYNFFALAIYAIIALLIAKRFIPKQKKKSTASTPLPSWRDYLFVAKNTGFISGIIAQGCTLTIFLAFNYYMSFYIQNILHYSILSFGYLSFAAGLSFILGCLLFRLMVNKINTNQLSVYSSILALLCAISLISLNIFASNHMMLIMTMICVLIFCSGIMASENIGITMMFFRDKASVASCLHTAIHFVIASLFMYILSLCAHSSTLTISVFYLIIIVVFLITNQFCYMQLNKKEIAHVALQTN